jgi:hypothetical protein
MNYYEYNDVVGSFCALIIWSAILAEAEAEGEAEVPGTVSGQKIKEKMQALGLAQAGYEANNITLYNSYNWNLMTDARWQEIGHLL